MDEQDREGEQGQIEKRAMEDGEHHCLQCVSVWVRAVKDDEKESKKDRSKNRLTSKNRAINKKMTKKKEG